MPTTTRPGGALGLAEVLNLPGSPRPEMMCALQAVHGNWAVQRSVAGQFAKHLPPPLAPFLARTQPPSARRVQRQPPTGTPVVQRETFRHVVTHQTVEVDDPRQLPGGPRLWVRVQEQRALMEGSDIDQPHGSDTEMDFEDYGQDSPRFSPGASQFGFGSVAEGGFDFGYGSGEGEYGSDEDYEQTAFGFDEDEEFNFEEGSESGVDTENAPPSLPPTLMTQPVRAVLQSGVVVQVLAALSPTQFMVESLASPPERGVVSRAELFAQVGAVRQIGEDRFVEVLDVQPSPAGALYILRDVADKSTGQLLHAQVIALLQQAHGKEPEEEEETFTYEEGEVLVLNNGTGPRLEVIEQIIGDDEEFYYLVEPVVLGAPAAAYRMAQTKLDELKPIVDPRGREAAAEGEQQRQHLATGELVPEAMTGLPPPSVRKQEARAAFEQWVQSKELTRQEIAAALPEVRTQFMLSSVSMTATDDGLIIAFVASPPDYTHIVPFGPDSTKAKDHPASAFTATKPELKDVESDSGLETPLGALMSQLGLPASDINLLVKGDLTKADRPHRVRATVVGARRRKGGRVGGAVTPATIAHLGHHEVILNVSDKSKWVSFYDGGHLIGDQLMPSKGGPDTFVEWNLAPMEQVLNQQSYLTWVENIIAAGCMDASNCAQTTVPISVIVSVYYPRDTYTVQEDDLAKSGIIPADGTGKPKSGQNRPVTIPTRVPHSWVLDAKVDLAAHTFKERSAAMGVGAKTGNTAFPYYDYSDLGTKTISADDRHWWKIVGASKSGTGKISSPVKSNELHFEAYQYTPLAT